jgi:hypothetical protein
VNVIIIIGAMAARKQLFDSGTRVTKQTETKQFAARKTFEDGPWMEEDRRR